MPQQKTPECGKPRNELRVNPNEDSGTSPPETDDRIRKTLQPATKNREFGALAERNAIAAAQIEFEPLLSVEQAVQLLGRMHVKTLQRMARNRVVPAYRIGRFWLFRASELNEWLRVQPLRQPVRVN